MGPFNNKSFISEPKLRLALLHRTGDLGAIFLSAFTAHLIAYQQLHLNADISMALALSVTISLWLYPTMGLYRAWRGERLRKELFNIAQAWTLNVLLLSFILYLTGNAKPSTINFFTIWYLTGLLWGLLGRIATRLALNALRAQGRNKNHIIVIGDNGLATSTISALQQSDWTGFNVVGYFGDSKLANEVRLGGYDDIKQFIDHRGQEIDQIWIAMPLSREKEIHHILDQLQFATQDVRLVPGMDGFRLINHSVTQIANMPVLNLQSSPISGMSRFAKAVEDRVLATIILVVASPLMIAIAVAIKVSSPGPVFYRQERVSRAGRAFMMYKFRSMPVTAERDGVQWGNAQSKPVTGLGRFLRKTSLDELPQFINVVLGDMSIVGPRPERTQFVNEFKHDISGYMQKHIVKAGITGWAQINGWRGDTDLQTRIDYDLYYINNWSLWMDLKIICLTLFKGFIHKNAG
jgi:putative colanic acid biosysnthesis UDP-glucose lipid carrier transferase